MTDLRDHRGVALLERGAEFSVWSRHAERVELQIFDAEGRKEVARLPMERQGDVHHVHASGVHEGSLYGYRAFGPYDPDRGLWFDPSKLLVDPYAMELDRPFRFDVRLGMFGEDTADLVPKARLLRPEPAKRAPPLVSPGGFIYEVAVRAFTMLHPDVPERQRGTIAALAHPSVIAHLKKIGVDAIELLPVTAWIDERHLPPLGLTNGWGYNPVAFMALDPRIAPGGLAELRETVERLHGEGIGVILDLVFNHTGESDRHGATLSLRGLDNPSYFRHLPERPGELVNDTGTGNTLACDQPEVRRLIIHALRHFVAAAGVDGFRFDLATVLGRDAQGFQRDGGTLDAILADELLADRMMIAEPWDIGPGGYQLGNFPSAFVEWNDRARDDMRRYWRGDEAMTGAFATRLAGSSDIFGRQQSDKTRSVNFLAAHDGFTLMDLVSYSQKHNEKNGEDNRDGSNENFSWNSGVEGPTEDAEINRRRRDDVKALLASLFVSRGTIMLTAGDEFARSQQGNNNAYCQDNAINWLDWKKADADLIEETAFLSALRKRFPALAETAFYKGDGDILWRAASGAPMTQTEWIAADLAVFGMELVTPDRVTGSNGRLAVLFNRSWQQQDFRTGPGNWRHLPQEETIRRTLLLEPRSVTFLLQEVGR